MPDLLDHPELVSVHGDEFPSGPRWPVMTKHMLKQARFDRTGGWWRYDDPHAKLTYIYREARFGHAVARCSVGYTAFLCKRCQGEGDENWGVTYTTCQLCNGRGFSN